MSVYIVPVQFRSARKYLGLAPGSLIHDEVYVFDRHSVYGVMQDATDYLVRQYEAYDVQIEPSEVMTHRKYLQKVLDKVS